MDFIIQESKFLSKKERDASLRNEYREEPLLFRIQKDDEVIINETKNIRK